MPGLLGLYNLKNNPIDARLFGELQSDLVKPVAYKQDEYLSPARSIAVARIHKGTFNPESQPVQSVDGKRLLFMDGEIFNDDLDLDRQPASILEAYRSTGTGLFERLNGSFCLIIYQPDHHRLMIVADRLATVPIHFTQQGDVLAFSAEIRPLLRVLNSTAVVNPLAVENFLASGFILDGQTLLKGVYSLRPGEVLTAEDGEVKVNRYWRFAFKEQRDLRDQAELEEELARLCSQAVRRQTRGNHVMAVPLSGGYDSRSILYFWKAQNDRDEIRTVTWGNDDTIPDTDAWIAWRLSERLGTNHHFFPLEAGAISENFQFFVQRDEGRTDAVGNYPQGLSIFERIRDELGIEVLLRGNEIFGARRKVFRDKDTMHTAFLDDLTSFPGSFQYIKPKVYKNLMEIGQEQMRQLHSLNPYEDPVDRKDYLFVTLRCSGYQSPLTQIKRQIIEERNPYQDHDVMDFVARLPSQYRVWKNLFMSTVRNRIEGSTGTPFSKRVSLIDWDDRLMRDRKLQTLATHVLFERQNGFDEIFDQKKLRKFVEQAFQPKKTNRRSLVNRANRKIRERLDHYELEVNVELFRLLILKIWVDEYLKGEISLS